MFGKKGDLFQLGTPDEPAPGAPAADGGQVSFGAPEPRKQPKLAAECTSPAAIVAGIMALAVLIFLLWSIGINGLFSTIGGDSSPLVPIQLSRDYECYFWKPQGRNDKCPDPVSLPLTALSKATIGARLEALKHLEDCGFTADARSEWLKLRLLTCTDDQNPVCVFASNRLRSLP